MINFLAKKFNLFKKINLLLFMIPNDFIKDLLMQSALEISFYKDKDHLVCLFQKPPHFSDSQWQLILLLIIELLTKLIIIVYQ